MNVGEKLLAVVADDLGIGPETSAGILDVAETGRLTATVLLVNTPYAEDALRQWQRRGRPVEIGWHPNLTLDRPLLPAREVPTLVDAAGRFHPRGRLMRRTFSGRTSGAEVRAEWHAQLRRFRELLGHDPRIVNAHQHLHVFPVLGKALTDVLAPLPIRPWLRRLGEPFGALAGERRALVKRLALHAFGRWQSRRTVPFPPPASGGGLGWGAGSHFERPGVRTDPRRTFWPGPDCLLGVTDPPSAAAPDFFAAWIARGRGRVAELMCHPGRRDETLLGRDCDAADGWLEQRTNERDLLLAPSFPQALAAAGRRIARIEELLEDADAARTAA